MDITTYDIVKYSTAITYGVIAILAVVWFLIWLGTKAGRKQDDIMEQALREKKASKPKKDRNGHYDHATGYAVDFDIPKDLMEKTVYRTKATAREEAFNQLRYATSTSTQKQLVRAYFVAYDGKEHAVGDLYKFPELASIPKSSIRRIIAQLVKDGILVKKVVSHSHISGKPISNYQLKEGVI